MKPRSITITFKSNAPEEVVMEIAQQMRWQLDSMCDGTLELDESDEAANYDYSEPDVEVK